MPQNCQLKPLSLQKKGEMASSGTMTLHATDTVFPKPILKEILVLFQKD